MKIFDCFMFYDENLLLEMRLNILDDFIDYFVIVESKHFHNGKERELIFNIDNYQKFKNKIIYIVHDVVPKGVEKILPNDSVKDAQIKKIYNALKRENDQRNYIMRGLEKANDNDLILISDVDEIPNLQSLNLRDLANEIILFRQDLFSYKLNRYQPGFDWFGTKACKKKIFKGPQWLRNIKYKDYSFFRIDTLFSEKKYINKRFINDGGWHFSNLKDAESIDLKLKSYLHHIDYELEEMGKNKIDDLIKSNKTLYDLRADKTSKKFSDEKREYLRKYDIRNLPIYIQKNLNKYKDWID